MKKISLILLVLWMSVIFFFSSEDGKYSKERSIEVISTSIDTIKKITGKNIQNNITDINILKSFKEKKIKKVENKVTTTNKNKIESNLFIIRKTAHIIEYFILGLLMINVLRYYLPLKKRLIIISIILCTLFACTDEIHQLFVPGRSGMITDVLVDLIGITSGVLIYYNLYKRIKIKKELKL